MKSFSLKLVPEQIKQIRSKLGLTQRAFGKLLYVTDATINRWEKRRGGISDSNMLMLECIYLALNKCKPKDIIETLKIEDLTVRLHQIIGLSKYGPPPKYPDILDEHLIDHQWGGLCSDMNCEFNKYNMRVRGDNK